MLVRRRTVVYFHPSAIRLANSSRIPEQHSAAVAHPVAADADDAPWRGSMAALHAELEKRTGKDDLQVVLSDHFVRYVSLPWKDTLVSRSDWLAYAKFAFAEIHGSAADRWQVATDRQAPGKACLACAIDEQLLQELVEATEKHNVQLGSVQSVLCERINRHHAKFVAADLCVVSIESGRLTLAFHDHSGWIAVRQRRIDGKQLSSLPAVLKQEAATVGMIDGGTAYLVGEDIAHLDSECLPGWDAVCINEPSPSPDEAPVSAATETVVTE